MSYDLMAFEAEGVPRELSAFLEWHSAKAEAAEESETSLNEPATVGFAAFYSDMVAKFPDMNRPSGDELREGVRLTGYEFQPNYIYMDFRWDVAEEAANAVSMFAHKHGLGFYDLNDLVIFPEDEAQSPAAPAAAKSSMDWFQGLFKS